MPLNPETSILKFVFLLRCIVGYDVVYSSKLRFLSRSYSVFIVTLMFYLCIAHVKEVNKLHKTTDLGEYSAFVLISLLSKDIYVLESFEPILLIDNLPCAEDMFRKVKAFILSFVLLILSIRLVHILWHCYNIDGACSMEEIHGFTILSVIWWAIDAGQYTIVMIFSLLYCRVKILKQTIQSYGFDRIPFKKYSARSYVRMYEALVDSLSYANLPVKFMVSILLCLSLPRVTYECFLLVSFFKRNGMVLFYVVSLFANILLTYLPLMTSVIIMDLVQDELNIIKTLTIEKCMTCTSERERSELQVFLDVMVQNPLQYDVLRVIPFKARVIFNCYSFALINIMAIVQIKSYDDL